VLRLKNKICEIVKKEQIDIIHAHSPCLWGLAALWAGRKLNKKVIYEIRAFWEDAGVDAGKYKEGSFIYKTIRGLETFLAKKVDKVVAICEGIKNDLVSRNISEDKIVIVPNGIDTKIFYPIPKSNKIIDKYALDGKIVYGFIGSMFNFEGLELLVEAASELKTRCNNMHFVLVGEGEKYEHIKKMVELKNLQNIITLVGKVPHDEVKEYYSVIDIHIYPRISKRITELVTPLKPLEAMAMAKTVLVSNVGGLRELILCENCGVTFKAGSVEDLSCKLYDLAMSPQKFVTIGKRARYEMEHYRSWKELVKIYENEVYVY